MSSPQTLARLAPLALGLVLAGPAAAQSLARPLLGALPPAPLPALRDLGVGDLAQAPAAALAQRTRRLEAQVRAHRDVLELDARGEVVRRGVVLALGPSDAALAAARAAGFTVEDAGPVEGLDLRIATLKGPPGLSADAAARRLRALDPGGTYDVDPLLAPAGAAAQHGGGVAEGAEAGPQEIAAVGMIDTGVDAHHPALAHSRIVQRAFAPDAGAPGAHGTAVASLIVGQDGAFRGADPGAPLLAADAFGQGPTGGAVEMVVRGLGWTAAQGARVVNMSLVGPPNPTLAAAVRAAQARGVLIVAPVGNDGPAAPPAYPASYPGVVAVTGVDGAGRPLIEAGRAAHLDFAAAGAEVRAAAPGGGWARLRGTSFAAPVVAGALARAEDGGASDGPAAIALVARSARPGSGYGRGWVRPAAASR